MTDSNGNEELNEELPPEDLPIEEGDFAPLQGEALEPRIMLSATWVDPVTDDAIADATDGADVYLGSTADDFAEAMGGEDTMFGDAGNDQLFGGAGNDLLEGGSGDDLLDGGSGTDTASYATADAGVTIDLTSEDAQDTGGAGTDTLTEIEGVVGSEHDDVFAFSTPTDGATYTVDGNGGSNTIDLSGFDSADVQFTEGGMSVSLGDGQAFSIEYTNVDTIEFGDDTATVLSGDHAATTADGTGGLFLDGDVAFQLDLDGAGSVDWSYDADSDTLTISDTDGTTLSSDIAVRDLGNSSVAIDSVQIEGDLRSFSTDSDLGLLRIRSGIGNDFLGVTEISAGGGSGTIDSIEYYKEGSESGTVRNHDVTVNADVGSISFANDLECGYTVNGDVGSITIGDDLEAGGSSSPALVVEGNLGSLVIGDDMKNSATVRVAGELGSFEADSVKSNGGIHVGSLGTFEVSGEMKDDLQVAGDAGTITTGKLSGDVTIGGDLDTLESTDLRGNVTVTAAEGAFTITDGGDTYSETFDGYQTVNYDGSSLATTDYDPPAVADAGLDQLVDNGAVVTLDASGSADPDGQPLTYEWVQVSGPTVILDDPTAEAPSFTAPDGVTNTDVVFQLEANDGTTTVTDLMTVTVGADASAPDAEANANVTGAWSYQYFDHNGGLSNLSQAGFTEDGGSESSLVPTETGVATTLDPGAIDNGNQFALRYTTTLTIDEPGEYSFKTYGDDGVKLFLDNVEIIDDDGLHSARARTSADQLLEPGTYELEVVYFENGGRQVLDVSMSGPDTDDGFVSLGGYDGVAAEALEYGEGDTVQLDASGSADPQGGGLTYAWTQVAGPEVSMDDSGSPTPQFSMPTGYANTEMVFEVAVSDGANTSIETVTVLLNGDVDAPDAEAGLNLTTSEGEQVTLDGGGSEDPGEGGLTYTWTQTGGPSVTLDDPSATAPTFTAPDADENYELTFQLEVSDGSYSSTDVVHIAVAADIDAPDVDAGSDQSVAEGDVVQLGVEPPGPASLDFSETTIDSYGGSSQDRDVDVSVEDNGETLHLTGNGWKKIDLPYTVTADTILEFDFKAPVEGEIHTIGFDTDLGLDANKSFKLHGTQNWGTTSGIDQYDGTGEWTHYSIRVGDYFTGDFDHLTFGNDDDAGGGIDSYFANVKVFEAGDVGPGEPAGDDLTYTWVQTGGPIVVLDDPSATTPTFTAPDLVANTDLTFELQVSDGTTTSVDSVTITVNADDDAPSAEAGPNQTVDEHDVVTLTGGGTDPEGAGLNYNWVQTGGPSVTLDDPSSTSPTFTAPEGLVNSDITFELQVSDGTTTSVDTVTITVHADDDAPIADAGTSQSVAEKDVVQLAGGGVDPEGEGLSYNWVQVGGPTVTLDDPSSPGASFDAPDLVANTELRFELHVSDGTSTSVDTVTITVGADNDAPSADAGQPTFAFDGQIVELSGTGSDPEGLGLTYEWVQVGGPAVILVDGDTSSPTFIAPPDDTAELQFELWVSDGVNTSIDTVNVSTQARPGPEVVVFEDWEDEDDINVVQVDDGSQGGDPFGERQAFGGGAGAELVDEDLAESGETLESSADPNLEANPTDVEPMLPPNVVAQGFQNAFVEISSENFLLAEPEAALPSQLPEAQLEPEGEPTLDSNDDVFEDAADDAESDGSILAQLWGLLRGAASTGAAHTNTEHDSKKAKD